MNDPSDQCLPVYSQNRLSPVLFARLSFSRKNSSTSTSNPSPPPPPELIANLKLCRKSSSKPQKIWNCKKYFKVNRYSFEPVKKSMLTKTTCRSAHQKHPEVQNTSLRLHLHMRNKNISHSETLSGYLADQDANSTKRLPLATISTPNSMNYTECSDVKPPIIKLQVAYKKHSIPFTENVTSNSDSTTDPLTVFPIIPNLPRIICGSYFKNLWDIMVAKEQLYSRNSMYFSKQKFITPNMRSVLLDWMIEVCESFQLHRETFYMSVDYIDRYLSLIQDVPCNQLQLLGVTSLFLAAKLEEVRPPRLSEFIKVTDGACFDDEVLEQERMLLLVLDHRLYPTTPFYWLTFYVQNLYYNSKIIKYEQINGDVNGENTISKPSNSTTSSRTILRTSILSAADTENFRDFVYPIKRSQNDSRNSTGLHLIAQIIDVAILDSLSIKFSYSKIAAAAIILTNIVDSKLVTGYSMECLHDCMTWLQPFVLTMYPHLVATQDNQFFFLPIRETRGRPARRGLSLLRHITSVRQIAS